MEEVLGGDESLEYIRKIGHGGFGGIHEVLDLKNQEVFARKVFHPRTTNEVAQNQVQLHKALSSRGHRNIVHVRKTGLLDQSHRIYIDMELCGKDLATYITERETPSLVVQDEPRKIWDIISQIVAGLKFLHDNRVVHRDLKPTNVLLSRLNGQWKISDFDLASLMGPADEVQTKQRRATEGYRPPELLLDTEQETIAVTSFLDIWALGCILFELWKGKKAFCNDFATRDYYQTNDHFMDKGVLSIKGQVAFSDADNTIFWREIAYLTQKEPNCRPEAQKVLENVGQILGLPIFNDAAVQTDPVVVICPPQQTLPVGYGHAISTISDAVVSPTNTHIVIGGHDKDRHQYMAQLWSIEPEVILWDTLLDRPVNPVIPTFSQDGRYLALSSGRTVEIRDIKDSELRIIWSFESTNSPTAICVRNGGDSVAYSYNKSWVASSSNPELFIDKPESEWRPSAQSKRVDVIESTSMSGVSLAYGPDGRYLYATGEPESGPHTLKGYVWDLTGNRRNFIKSLTFLYRDYLESPVRAFSLADPSRSYLAVLSSNPRPQDEMRTILRLYTGKGTITHQVGCGWMIFTPSLEAVFILSVGRLFYHDRDLPKFEYGLYDDPDDEPKLACRWCYVKCPALLPRRVEDYNATGSKLPLCLWKWNGKDEEPQWVGILTTEVTDFEDVKAFVLHGHKVKLWLQNGDCVKCTVKENATLRV